METFEQTISHSNYFAKAISFSKIKILLLYLPLSLLITFFVFSSTIYIPFYHHDSYKFSTGTHSRNCIKQGLLIDTLGRPIDIYLDCLNYKYANSLDRMSHLRLFCIVWISILISLFALWLTTIDLPAIPAFFLSSSLFLLSALQTTIIMGAAALLFAISSALLSFSLFQKGYLQICHNNYPKQKILSSILVFGAFLLLLISMLTYPPLSAFFIVPLFLIVLFRPLSSWKDIRKLVSTGIFIFGVCCFLYFLIGKLIQLHQHVNYAGTPAAFTPNYHIIVRIVTLVQVGSDFWNIHFNNIQFWFFFIIILGGISSGILKFTKSSSFNANKPKAISYLLQLLVTFFILTIAGNIVILVSPGPAFVGRVAFTLHCMIAAMLFWSLLNICYLFKKTKDILMIIVTAVFFTSIGIYANYNVTTSAMNDNLELNFVVSTIANYMLLHGNHFSRIHIIMPTVANFNGKRVMDDIYNYNSTAQPPDEFPIINAALVQLVRRYSFSINDCPSSNPAGMLLQDQINCVNHNPKNAIALTFTRSNDPYFKSPNTILINMNAIDVLASKTKPSLNTFNSTTKDSKMK